MISIAFEKVGGVFMLLCDLLMAAILLLSIFWHVQ